jgi:hypothetical protein
MKAKGKRKSRCGTVIGMEDQQRPALGTAIKQKYVQSHGKREHSEYIYKNDER